MVFDLPYAWFSETVRQAGLLVGHAGFGVPRDHHFVMEDLGYALGDAGLRGLAVTTGPASLMLTVGCQDVRMRHGRLASLRVHAEITRDGLRIGHGSGQLRVVTPASYERLRGPGRGVVTPPLPPEPAAPELVGRAQAADVVLSPTLRPDTWLLRADAGHPVLFDHELDHVPGMLVLEAARQALALFGSTSPSYLILQSLDLCNRFLSRDARLQFALTVTRATELKQQLSRQGWTVAKSEPLKIVVCSPSPEYPGTELARRVKQAGVEWEYADPDYLVLMASPGNREEDFLRAARGLSQCPCPAQPTPVCTMGPPEPAMSIRQALLAPWEEVPLSQALGRICGAPTVSCPPAVPVVVSGERISRDALAVLARYGIHCLAVVKESI